jgi:NAD(P)-dependent dehydrogenase (short-subunit alcohol dehydrogenase family)
MGMLDGKVVIVTGASSGIGASCAEVMAAEGANVVGGARRKDRLEELAAKIGGNFHPVVTDVKKEADILNLFAECEKTFGAPHIVVNCAGFAQHKPTVDMTLADWNDIIETNLTSVFLCSREAFKVFKPLGRGRIINIGSISAKMPRPDNIGYPATKAAIEAMTHSLSMDGREFGITASCLHIGATVSELSPNMDTRNRDVTMATEDVSRTVLHIAAMPDETNIFNLVMIPIRQPYLARG